MTGHLLLVDNGLYVVDRQFATVAVLSAMAIALFGALALLERRIVHWR